MITGALRRAGGDPAKAARDLGVTSDQFRYHASKLGL
jgi:transcriptional regulator with GAF, ATPase, and Fis domain